MAGQLFRVPGCFFYQLHNYRHKLFAVLFLVVVLGSVATTRSMQMDALVPIGPTWDTQQVDNRDFNLGRGLCLDAQGHPHIAYGGSHLYYAWYDGISWRQETVDDTLGVGGNASLALDAAGNPHIAYNGLGSIKYAHWTGSEWQILTLDSNSASPSLVLDNAGHPHIAYQKGSSLGYAHWTGSGWDIQTTDLGGGTYPVLALDSAGNPHLIYSYLDANQTGWEDGLRYAHWTGSAWQMHIIESVTDRYLSFAPLSLVVDQANNPHIYY